MIKAVALAEGLHNLGNSVEVVTSSVIERNGSPSWQTYTDSVNGIQVTYLGTWFEVGMVSLNPAVLPFALSEVNRFDAVHIIGLYDALGLPVAFAARRAGVPYSVEPSGMLIPIVRSLRLKSAYHSVFGRSMLDGSRNVVVTSRVEWHDAEQFGVPSEKLICRRNGIDLGAYNSLPERGIFRRRFGIPEETPLILWLGRIEQKKNLEQLLEALSLLTRRPWNLAVVGPSESAGYLNSLRQFANRFNIEKRVHFIAGLYDQDKLAAFSDSDMFVLVSVHENWGNSVLEAIAAGVPVLVTRTCGVSEIVEGRAGLVVEQNVDAIREGLGNLLSDCGLYRKFKAQLPGLASEISWDKPTRQMAELFESWQVEIVKTDRLRVRSDR